MNRLMILLFVPIVAFSQTPKKETEVLRDSKGHKVGTVKKENGTEKIYDEKNHYRGQYRSGDNVTRDSKGHKVGTGNQNVKNLEKGK